MVREIKEMALLLGIEETKLLSLLKTGRLVFTRIERGAFLFDDNAAEANAILIQWADSETMKKMAQMMGLGKPYLMRYEDGEIRFYKAEGAKPFPNGREYIPIQHLGWDEKIEAYDKRDTPGVP